MSRNDLNNSVAVVVGGSGGIGAATVRMLAEEGAKVVIGYNRGREKAEALAAALPGTGHLAHSMSLDDSATIRNLAAEVSKRFKKIDILVNTAGFTTPIAHSDLDALTDELFDSVLTANVRGVFATIRAFAPLLRASGNGVIVNLSSISGFTGSGSSIAYCASKGALDTMTMSLARALGPQIRVLAVSPGAVATDFVAGRGREALEKIAQGTPLKKIVEPEDVALAVMACITHLPSTTGSRITVDGGRFLV